MNSQFSNIPPTPETELDQAPRRTIELTSWFDTSWKAAVHSVRARGIHLDPEQLVMDAVVRAWLTHQRTGEEFVVVLRRRLYFDPISAYRTAIRRWQTASSFLPRPEPSDGRQQGEDRYHDRRDQIACALRQLPRRDRRLVWLHFRRGLSHAQIADRPDLKGEKTSETAVKCRVSRAYRQLRLLLAPLARDRA